ncbi:O-fucosyltransferase 10-like isoform X1 [Rhododendron vialii]|uniref:O-fucosyltransferase 10-like isoform X1 n=1 Tax=Rhododendron vialii TaxID=182163 RepID=UPI00265E0B22|nr:O-fucosyltransferase 10-like isoform X1 [Rhododendron vialii]
MASPSPPMKPKAHHYTTTTPVTTATTTTATTTTANNSSDSTSPSPPPSPRRHSNFPQCRRRRLPKRVHSFPRRESFIAGIFLRRGIRYFLLLPLLYLVSGLIMCVGPFSLIMHPRPLPGSVYRSHEIFDKLWDDIRSDNSSAIELSSIWRYKRKLKEQKPCPQKTGGRNFGSSMLGKYLVVEANGGLNQQRSSICNAVAVAGLLNATLVIPQFEFHSVWKDPSQFSDIYDEEHFTTTLQDSVKVVHELPLELMEVYDFNISNIPIFRVQAWATAKHYLEEVYPVLSEQRVIRIAPFANRLALDVPRDIQFLRCLANYEALRFSLPISTLAKKLVNRMIDKSSSSEGKYVSVHLRFEEDMVAFSCCVYDGGEAEKSEMDSIRVKGWGKKFKRKAHIIAPDLNRINGKCPMTPLEVGMMLRGMGFSNNTPIYLASGNIYRAARNLAPLLKMFPLLQTKESLAAPEELASFEGYSSRLAALDYMVCLFSEVFVTTQGGNFPHFLMGHRRFLYNGHAKTIKPDKTQLVFLLQDTRISWKAFKDQMKTMVAESDRKGIMVPRVRKSNRKASVFSNPIPDCRCLWESTNLTLKLTHTSHAPYL